VPLAVTVVSGGEEPPFNQPRRSFWNALKWSVEYPISSRTSPYSFMEQLAASVTAPQSKE
jgi:hypothetical protein